MNTPVYLFTGPELGQRNDEIEATKEKLKKKFGDVEEYLFYASETPAVEYLSILQNESLFSSCTCVVVKNADSIKKEEAQLITNWISSLTSETNVLILVSDSISIDSKIEKAVPPAQKKIFWELKEESKFSWVQNFFSKNGYTIVPDAVSIILEMIENNTQALRQECSRFFVCFPKDHVITEEDVESVLINNREENVFTLFDAMCKPNQSPQERFSHSLEVLQKVLLSKENSSVMLIAGLTSCFRKVCLWIKLQNSGKNDDFNLKINGFTSKKQKTQYASAAKIWKIGEATAILAVLSQTDMEIRSGGSLLETTYLQKLIYEIVIKKGAMSAVYSA